MFLFKKLLAGGHVQHDKIIGETGLFTDLPSIEELFVDEQFVLGQSLPSISGLYDAVTGKPVSLYFNGMPTPVTEINCVDVCVDPQPDPFFIEGTFWAEALYRSQLCNNYYISATAAQDAYVTWSFWPVTDRRVVEHATVGASAAGCSYLYNATAQVEIDINGTKSWREAGFRVICSSATNSNITIPCIEDGGTPITADDVATCPAEIYTPQCEEYPWDTPDCYHIEKRSDQLKAGWDNETCYQPGETWLDPDAQEGRAGGYRVRGSEVWIFTSPQAAAADFAARFPVTWSQNGVGNWITGALGSATYGLAINANNTEMANNGYPASAIIDYYHGSCSYTGGSLGVSTSEVPNCNGLPAEVVVVEEQCCQPPTEPEGYNEGYFWAHSSGTYANCHAPSPQGVFDCVKEGIEFYNGVVVTSYYCISGCDNNGPQYWEYQFYVPSTPETTYTNPMGFVAKANCLNGSHSTEPYCNPDYSDPEDCEPYPLTQEEDCCGVPQDSTTPQGIQWSSDGEVSYHYNMNTGELEGSKLDPDLYEGEVTCGEDMTLSETPGGIDLLDGAGNPVRIYEGVGNTNVITYDSSTNGGVAYIVRDKDTGQITAAGSGSSQAQYIDYTNPSNFG